MATTLYDKGWGMEHLWEKEKFDKEKSLSYEKVSYYLNLFLGKEIQYKLAKEHIKKVYEEEI